MSTTRNQTPAQTLAQTLDRHRREVAAAVDAVEAERRENLDALQARLNADAAAAIQAAIAATRAAIVGDRTRDELQVIPTGVPSALAAEVRQAAKEAEAQGRRRPGHLVFVPRPDRFGHAPATAFALIDVSGEVFGR